MAELLDSTGIHDGDDWRRSIVELGPIGPVMTPLP